MNTNHEYKRHQFTGVWQIVRYNWPQYLVAAMVILALSVWLDVAAPTYPWLRASLWAILLITGWWSAASLIASHWIYDVSELYRWTWIPDTLPTTPQNWLNLHAGLDESSDTLRRLFQNSTGTTADFFDAAEMSEPSIHRARNASAAVTARCINYRKFPFADGAFDTAFVIFAAHEIRHAASREIFFHELRRVLAPGGRILLVEHARDFANFAAYGPGFLHFLPPAEWRRLANSTGLKLITEKRLTPFVRVIQLRSTL